jgi:hypothetical protein
MSPQPANSVLGCLNEYDETGVTHPSDHPVTIDPVQRTLDLGDQPRPGIPRVRHTGPGRLGHAPKLVHLLSDVGTMVLAVSGDHLRVVLPPALTDHRGAGNRTPTRITLYRDLILVIHPSVHVCR